MYQEDRTENVMRVLNLWTDWHKTGVWVLSCEPGADALG